MSEMIERVARAIAASNGISWDGITVSATANGLGGEDVVRKHERLARSAIEAMREPTDEMKAPEDVHWGYSCHVCGGLTEGWCLMIDAALKG